MKNQESAAQTALLQLRADLHELFHKHPIGNRTLRRLLSYYGAFTVANAGDSRSADIALAKRDVLIEIARLAAISDSEFRSWAIYNIPQQDLTFKQLVKLAYMRIKRKLKL